jgi:hypothetical protein
MLVMVLRKKMGRRRYDGFQAKVTLLLALSCKYSQANATTSPVVSKRNVLFTDVSSLGTLTMPKPP